MISAPILDTFLNCSSNWSFFSNVMSSCTDGWWKRIWREREGRKEGDSERRSRGKSFLVLCKSEEWQEGTWKENDFQKEKFALILFVFPSISIPSMLILCSLQFPRPWIESNNNYFPLHVRQLSLLLRNIFSYPNFVQHQTSYCFAFHGLIWLLIIDFSLREW